MSGRTLTANEAAFLEEAQPWGVILMGRSCGDPVQVRGLVEGIWAALDRSAPIFIDQEGGRVRRLRPPHWPDFPAPGVYGALYGQDADLGLEAAWLGHRLIAAELQPMGVLADCAPVLDLVHPGAHQIVGDRSFGANPDVVARLARAALNGLRDGGVVGVIKHMPGHGRARVDSHDALPVVGEAALALAPDMAPFRALKDAPMAMTAHLALDAWDPGVPATVSPIVIGEVIRRDIGFDGLLMTDDLGMKALGGSLTERTRRALAAGCDVGLHCAGFVADADEILKQMEEVAAASPKLSGVALERARAVERAMLAPLAFDRDEGCRQLEELLGRAGGATA